MKKDPEKQVHGRRIEVATYEYDGQSVVVEGRLTDTRFRNTYYLSGELRPPGIVHDLIIRMRVTGPDLIIEDIDVEMASVPRDDCREIEDSLRPVVGLKISAGFTERVKALVGGPRGCTHLVALLLTMAPAAVQGAWAAVAQRPIDFGSYSEKALEILENTCWIWRSEGPLIQEYKEKFDQAKTRK